MTQVRRVMGTIPYVLIYALAGMAVMLLAWVAYIIVQPPPPPTPPLEYTEKYPRTAQTVYAPGDILNYAPVLTYKDWGPATFTRTFWRRDAGPPGGSSAVLCDGNRAPEETFTINLPFEVVGVYREGNVNKPIPPMPPGQYWFVGSVKGANGGKAQYQVAFVVARPCSSG
jgi:hypothetical protein